MINLLPDKEKKKVRLEYLFRTLSVIAFFVMLAGIVFLAFMTPSYFLTKYRIDDLANRLGEAKRLAGSNADKDKLNSKLAEIKEKISYLKPSDDPDIAQIFSSIIRDKNSNIKIKNLSFQAGDIGEIKIGGVSSDRDSLKQFGGALKNDALIKNIDLPISDFAKGSNIDFSIKAQSK
jgi:hypothetical protein